MPLRRVPRSALARAGACAFCLGLLVMAACGGDEPAKGPNEARDLEMKHESCDVDSGSAQKIDVNNDGNFDIIHVQGGGREVCRRVDMNFDGVPDSFIYFDDQGRERRRESDFDRDGIPDELTLLEGGVIIRKERETNFDRKLDTWDTYVGGRLAKSERDSNADGIIDEWWDYNRPDNADCAIVVSDRDGDRQPDPNTAVDMCDDGYKPPPSPQAGAAASASAPPVATAPPTPPAPPDMKPTAPPSPAPPTPTAAKP